MRIESFKTVAENAADAILAEINRSPMTPSRLVLANLVREALVNQESVELAFPRLDVSWGKERTVARAMQAQVRADAAKGDDFEGFGVIALIIGAIYGMALAGAVGYWLA